MRVNFFLGAPPLEMPHLRDQQNQLDNLEATIKLREADLATRASKNTVPKDEYDRVVALLARTQQDLARTQQDLADARQVMMAVGSQLLTQARGEAGAGLGSGGAAVEEAAAEQPPPVPAPSQTRT